MLFVTGCFPKTNWRILFLYQSLEKWKEQAQYVCHEKIKKFCEAQGIDFSALEAEWMNTRKDE